MNTRLLLTLFAYAAFTGLGRAEDTPPAASDTGTAVVCFGDSITFRGYPAVLAKKLGVTVVNAGVNGNTTAQGLKRIKKDVLDHKPQVVVVLFGSNDIRVDDPRIWVPLDKYEANLGTIIESCEKIPAQVVLCSIPPVNQEGVYRRTDRAKFEAAGGLLAILDQYRAVQFKVADKYKIPVVDLNKILPAHPEWLMVDGVHPTAVGNDLIAQEVAKVVGPMLKKPGAP